MLATNKTDTPAFHYLQWLWAGLKPFTKVIQTQEQHSAIAVETILRGYSKMKAVKEGYRIGVGRILGYCYKKSNSKTIN
jgi:hypothetical protein